MPSTKQAHFYKTMETLIAIILGWVVKKCTDIAKKYNQDPFEILVLFCFIIGFGYALFDMFTPGVFKENIISLVATTGLTAVSIHELTQRINNKK